MTAQDDAATPAEPVVEPVVEPVEAQEPATPLLKVIDAHATPEEVAAIVTVLSAMGGGAAPAPRPARSQWAHPVRQMAPVAAAGRGGWRASALPR